MTPFKSLHPLILNTVLLSEWSTAVFCLVIVVHESLVCPEQLNCHKLFGFQHFVYLNPFQMTVWFWDPSFHTEDDWGTFMHYYRRFKHSPMLQKEKPSLRAGRENFWTEFCLNIIFFHLVLPFRSYVSQKTN